MENPYQTTNSNPITNNSEVFQQDRQSERIEATGLAQSALYSSKGWVRLISVLGFIYFGIMALIVFFTLSFLGSGAGGYGVMIVFMTLVMTVITFMLALRLSRFSSSIARAEVSRNPHDLEDAIYEQMRFWRLTGIMTLVVLVLFILSLISP